MYIKVTFYMQQVRIVRTGDTYTLQPELQPLPGRNNFAANHKYQKGR